MDKKQEAIELFSYCPDTGQFFWNERGQHHFKNKRSHNKFNNCYAGRPVPDRFDKDGYRTLAAKGKDWKSHRVAWLLYYGEWPDGQIDHINRIKHDNRIVNLRLATPSIQARNKPMRRDNTSGYPGVTRAQNGNWRAAITIERKPIHLGTFVDKADAIAARQAAEREHGFVIMETRNAR